jgi:hypothetical protein
MYFLEILSLDHLIFFVSIARIHDMTILISQASAIAHTDSGGDDILLLSHLGLLQCDVSSIWGVQL